MALVDVRPLLDGSGPVAIVETRELRADDWVYIPTGVAHGFLALDPLQLVYLVTNEYDGSDELGFAWDDPALARGLADDRRDRGRTPDPVGQGHRQPDPRGTAGAAARRRRLTRTPPLRTAPHRGRP